MIQAKTFFEFICPRCRKIIKKEANLTLFDYKIRTEETTSIFGNIDILWEGSCPECDEYLYDIRL